MNLDWNFTEIVPKAPINNVPVLFQIITCRRPGDEPLYSWPNYGLGYASLGLNALFSYERGL